MKAVTEFPNYTINKAIAAKAALATEGKTPEEIQLALGTTFKYEGDKLGHFVRAVEVAEKKPDELKRVMVISLNEGENPPPRAEKIEDHYYVPEYYTPVKAPVAEEKGKGKGRGKGGGKRDGGGSKSSPWGLTPEEKQAKINAGKAAQKAKAAAGKS